MRNWMRNLSVTAAVLAAGFLTACNSTTTTTDTPSATPSPVAHVKPSATPTKNDENYRGLIPFKGVKAPKITKYVTVLMCTDMGNVTLEVYPQAAPNAAKRFIELIKRGFYNNTPIFRVVPEFVCQFGINWRPNYIAWKNRNFKDDPTLFQLEPGTLAFAKTGEPNTNSTQVFINYVNNDILKDQGFTVFGRVVDNAILTEQFKRVGDPNVGLDQDQLWRNGERYLEEQARDQPTMITKLVIQSSVH